MPRAWQSKPYLMVKKKKDNEDLVGNDRYEGYCVDLAEKICKALGIKCELQLVADEKYGEKEKNNGTWNGMVGELTRKVRDSANI